MASKTDDVNWALDKLGETGINDVDTDSVEKARVMKRLYDPVKASLLQRYPWSFAIKRTSLSPDVTAPDWGYTYQYTLPTDYLAMYELKDDTGYNIESGKILTDEGPVLRIRYIRRATTETFSQPLFSEALATRLAWEACEKITQSTTKKDNLNADFLRIIHEAKSANAIEQPEKYLPESSWLESRV